MESLNLNTLATSLPTANLANAEKDLLNNFKAAALSITTLYRSSRHTSKRAYNAGYAAACQDLLSMIQQGVSVGNEASDGEGGMSIGRVMDWVEARLEAVRSREEEEEEDEEREKTTKDNGSAKPTRPKETAPVTPRSPPHTQSTQSQSQPLSQPMQLRPRVTPSPPPPTPRLIHNLPPARTKSRPSIPLPLSFPFPSSVTTATDDVTAGAKRRHAVMMMLDSTSSPPSSSSQNTPPSALGSGVATRRRTRSSRGAQNYSQGADAMMDIEEDGSGRERKRVARR